MTLTTLLFLVPVIYVLVRTLYNLLLSPLRSIPGPLPARFTSLWFFRRVQLGSFEWDNIALHRKYSSSIVRYEPNSYSFSAPAAIPAIYGHGHEFNKARWYESFSPPHGPGIFTLQDNKQHGQLRKKFQATYAMSSMVNYESFADECIKIFVQKLENLAAKGEDVDMGWWFQCYAADTIGMITFSKRFGFLDEGKDIGGLAKAMHKNLTYASLVGIYYNFHIIIFNTFAKLSKLGLLTETGRMTLMNFAARRKEERKAAKATQADFKKGNIEDDTVITAGEREISDGFPPKDFLEKFLDATIATPETFTEKHVDMGMTANVVAGSDTTAASLSAILYHLLRSPDSLSKLRTEMSSVELSSPPTFSESQTKLPYLQAVIQESLRLHPAVGLPLVRVVPSQGVEIDGRWFPGGTQVAVNPWVIHYSTEIWGDDAEVFRPERWIEAKVADGKDGGKRSAQMNRMWMPFGLGSRTCIGKNVSILEISKVAPEILQKFDFELLPELKEKGWRTKNHWFVIPQNFYVNIKQRNTEP